MRYKLLRCVFVLLIATPVLATEFSPIVVKTGKPTPSVLRTGEPFQITYRAEFFDTVLIKEEDMQPGSLALEKIEVISLQVNKNPFERSENYSLGFVNVWEFTYTFRIIQPEKDVYKIPSFNFIWVEKKAGVTADEAKEKEKPREMPTDEVGVGYVSSVRPADKPVKPPPLDIRDEQKFVSPIADGAVLRKWAYGVIGTASLLTMIIIFRFARYSKIRQSPESSKDEAGAETMESEVMVNMEPILLPKQARKKFLKDLKKLQNEAQSPTLELEKKIRLSVRLLLLSELQGMIRASMSENEIYAKLNGLEPKHKNQVGSKYAVMMDLSRRMRTYQEDIDSGKCFLDPGIEIAELRAMVYGLKLRKRISFLVTRYFVGDGQ